MGSDKTFPANINARDKISQAFFLALIAAVSNKKCQCETCKILRKVYQLMKKDLGV